MPVKKGLIPLYDAKALMIRAIERQSAEPESPAIQRVVCDDRPIFPFKGERHVSDHNEAVPMTGELDDPVKRLWLAVIEQAVFDAHLHTTAGAYPAVIWVADARRYFTSEAFEFACECLDVAPDWVRGLNDIVESIARELRGDEYESAAKPKPSKRPRRQSTNFRQGVLI